ncbi:MAG: hypothetical protein R3E73_03895 [Porticoccaceae bacterium]
MAYDEKQAMFSSRAGDLFYTYNPDTDRWAASIPGLVIWADQT